MVQITKENGMQSAGVPFAWVEVQYPDKAQWDETGFYDMVEQHVAALREQYREYVRADVFGQNPYFRYFRKFKKTYPVMMQFESVLLKGREFPRWNAVTAVPFLVELETHVLCGTHDIDRLMGPVELYQAEAKEPFEGLRGDEVHTYPGDVTFHRPHHLRRQRQGGRHHFQHDRWCGRKNLRPGGKPSCVLSRLRRLRAGARRTAQRADAHGGIRSAPRGGCADRV